MEWTLKEVKAELNRLSKEHNDVFSIPVTINGRLTRTLGRVFHRGSDANGFEPTRMEFSKQFLETSSGKSVVDVIGHEWCHYYITKTTRENQGHNAAFKALCSTLGVNGETTTKVERTIEVADKYDVFCSCCGKKIGGFSRMCKTVTIVKNGLATSKCCNKKATLVQNW